MSSKSAEPIEIIGIVQPPGAGGAKSGTGKLWSLVFSVHPWRRQGGLLDLRKLRLVQDGFTDAQLRRSMGSIKPYTVVRALVRLINPSRNMLLSATVLKVRHRNDADAELRALAEEQQKPIVFANRILGPLTFERGQDSFQARLSLAGEPVELSIGADGEVPDPATLAIAERFWKDRARWDQRLRKFAAAQLTELKNDTWLQEDEQPLTEAEFVKKLTPNSMSFHPPDGFTIYYNDGDIFWGHAIEISGTLSDGPQSADIAG